MDAVRGVPEVQEGVASVTQLDDTHLHWVAEFEGKRHEWDAEIAYQQPDERVAWRSTEGKGNSGEVRFHPLEGNRTRLEVEMSYEPEGLTETLGSALGADDRRVKDDLDRFKELVESRGVETGA